MVPIKIECECGQNYAFDVEPLNGRMPTRVACPTCGADGTTTANDTIARHLGPPPAPIIRLVEAPPQRSATATVATHVALASPPPHPPAIAPVATIAEAIIPKPSTVRVSVAANTAQRTTHAPKPGRPDPRLGLVDRNQAEHEARAKAMWGDTKEEIVSYLMIQGFSMAEANELVAKLIKERTGEIRRKGISKVIRGIGLMCVPVVALLYFLSIHIIPAKLFGLTVMIGLYGFYLFVRGGMMALAPKSEQGDVADQ